MKRAVGRLSLALRFALFCFVILVVGAFIIGSWVSREVEHGVTGRTAAVTALYVDSFVRPHLGSLETRRPFPEADIEALTSLLEGTSLGREIVSFKVWSTEGEIVFATDRSMIGETFAVSDGLRAAFAGKVESHISDLKGEENRFERQYWSSLAETYAPVRSASGEVVGVVEFYQLPQDLLARVRASQTKGWLIVGASTVVMYLILVGLVGRASSTITRQNRHLQASVAQQQSLQRRIRALNQRLRRAAIGRTETDEELFRRLAQDLHDGPAQDLSLALLRLDSLETPDGEAPDEGNLTTIRFALRHALDEIRGISTGLRLPQLDGLGWRDVVERAVSDHKKMTGVTVHVAGGEVNPSPNQAQRITAYRVVQEALSNVSRHSGAEEAWVTVSTEDDWFLILVEDRGHGFEVGRSQPTSERRARLGLQGMRERVELIGGRCTVTSVKGQGTTVVARLPLILEEGL